MTDHHFTDARLQHQLKRHRELLDRFGCNPTPEDYLAFEQSKSLLMRLAQVENSGMAVFDMNRKNYAFIHSKFSKKVGFDLNEAYAGGPAYFFGLMPEEDLLFVIDSEIKTFEFLDLLPPQEKKDYKLIFEFRLKDPKGKIYRFVQQNVVLEQDAEGNIWMVLILNDLIPNPSGGKPLQRKLLHLPSGKTRLFDDQKPGARVLTRREMEILGLIAEGLQSKEISDRLFISVNTVNNHRQRIIEKTGSGDTAGALAWAKTIGII